MMSSRNSNKGALRVAGLGCLAIAASALSVQGARVFCRIVSASSTRIQYQDGYAEALIDIAESICNEATGQPIVVPINERISAVAFAQAEAVASVVGTCAGDGNAQLQVRARRRAEAQATAVGTASANIVASSGVCGLCETALTSFAIAVETLTANAVAVVDLDATYQFTGEPLTVNVVQQVIEREVAELLSTITGEVRSSALDGCSANALGTAQAGAARAECDVSISASEIVTEIDAVADAGLEVQAFGCDGVDSFVEVELQLREVAVAVAQAVSQATAFCETTGGVGTMACGVSRGTVDSVATATAQAFALAIGEAYGPECNCEVATRLDAQEMATIIAEASVSSLAEVCVEGTDYARVFDFQNRAQERLAEALAESYVQAFSGDIDCGVAFGLVAEVNLLPSFQP